MAKLDYNPEEYLNDEYTPIPAGKYRVFIDDTQVVDLKNNAGKGMRVTFKVLDGPYEKRILSSLYSIWHVDRDKCTMSRQMFARLCNIALGTPKPADTDELAGCKLCVDVTVNEQYNNVKKIYAFDGPKQARPSTPSAPSAPATPSTPPAPAKPAPPANDWNPDECPF